jgi:hypothetical protein
LNAFTELASESSNSVLSWSCVFTHSICIVFFVFQGHIYMQAG